MDHRKPYITFCYIHVFEGKFKDTEKVSVHLLLTLSVFCIHCILNMKFYIGQGIVLIYFLYILSR